VDAQAAAVDEMFCGYLGAGSASQTESEGVS
jgi:hypothetical protein